LKSEFVMAINQICSERNLPQEIIFEAIESALVSAYRRNFGGGQNIKATIDVKTGEPRVFAECIVVDKVEDERFELGLKQARKIDPEAELGQLVQVDVTPRSFGRIAAQTAKQVILQRIREAERDALFSSYADREGELINGMVANVTSHAITLNLGRTEAIMPRSQQVPGERYRIGQRIRAYVMDVRRTSRGPQIVVSRTHRRMLRRLLELEVPEIYNGTVEIKAIAREAGSRSKVAVAALQEGVDPVGSCVGIRGMRIQSIVNELGGEKIDVVEWSPDTGTFIGNALSPARVKQTILGDGGDSKTATVVVPDDQLSLAIGKEGQNARLAAKLTGWRIDIKSTSEAAHDALRPKGTSADISAKDRERDILAMAEAILLGKAPSEAEATAALEEAAEAEQAPEAEAAAEGEMVAEEAEPVVAQESQEDQDAILMEAEAVLAQQTAAQPAEDIEEVEEIVEEQVTAELVEAEGPEAEVEAQSVEQEASEPEAAEVAAMDAAAAEAAAAEAAETAATEAAAMEAAAAEDMEDETEAVLEMDAESVPEEKSELKPLGVRTRQPEPEKKSKSKPKYQYVRDERLDVLEDTDEKPRRSRRRRRQLVLDEETGQVISRRRHKREDDEDWDRRDY
jgi:N utilization substance protein A